MVIIMENLPKILSVSLSTWRKDSGIHTQTDLFKFWNPDKVAQIYVKSDLPNTDVCNKFFQISENAVIHSVFNRKPVGKEVFNSEVIGESKAFEAEKRLYEKAHKKKSWLLTIAREIVWSLGNWKTKALDEFVTGFNADVYFMPIYPVVYMGKIQLYILKKYPKPYVCYLADDNYSYDACGTNIFAWIHRFMLRRVVRKLAVNCSEMFTITKTEAEDTDRLFGTHSVVLTKGISYENLSYFPIQAGKPIKMVYTGNLLIGRSFSLAEISKAMAKINEGSLKITFDIYTPTALDKKTELLLNSNGCTLHKPIKREEVIKIQKSADVVVFAESLEKRYKNIARLSFSTKLTDYFASGKCIFAIGDKNIAPIQYLKDNNAAIIATEYSQILDKLSTIIENPQIIDEYGRKAFECGQKNHDETKVREVFINTFIKAVEKNDF